MHKNENETHKIHCNFKIKMDHPTWRHYLMLISKKKRTNNRVDLAFQADYRFEKKKRKYRQIPCELKHLWIMKLTMIAEVVVKPLETILSNMGKRLCKLSRFQICYTPFSLVWASSYTEITTEIWIRFSSFIISDRVLPRQKCSTIAFLSRYFLKFLNDLRIYIYMPLKCPLLNKN